MNITQALLDSLTEQAKANPRLRQSMDLRNSPDDKSQRMLNAIEPGSDMPIHRHMGSSETCLCVRGHFVEYFYDEKGNVTDTFDMLPGGLIISVPIGQWHNLKSLESGTVLFECKDGPYEPQRPADILSV